MLNIALFGPPGAGKGTQSEFLINKYNLHYISTGDILRKEIAEKTKLGRSAEEIIAQGKLVPDEIIVQIIEKTITENTESNGFLFDGFPRTYVQAYILEGLMLKLHTSLNCLISLEVDEDEAVKRLLNRAKTSGRADDNEEVIRKRLQEYNSKTLPVLEFYKDKGIVREVNGLESIDVVSASIKTVVKEELNKSWFNLVLFGYPGAGRSYQGKAIAKEFNLEFIDTGEMLEEAILNHSEYSSKITEAYLNGQFVPDEIVIKLIENKLAKAKEREIKGFLFKGYPRTLVQSYILDGLLKKHNSSISMVVEIDVPTLELVRRLDIRSKTDECMPYDANATKIVQRLQEHEVKTVPVIDKYHEIYGVTKVNGLGTFDEVFERIKNEVNIAIKTLR